MSCTSPMIRIPNYTINPDTGKNGGYLMSWSKYQQERGLHYKSFYEWKDHYMETHPEQILYGAPQLIPCGKCASCRLQYSREWANRCMLELEDHKSAYFLTLTYDDDHLFNKNGDPWSPDMKERPSLVKNHVSQFMRKLRDGSGQDLRFFAAGEYGTDPKISPKYQEKIFRPHYHLIVFGLIIPDLKFYKRSDLGDNYYTSAWLNKFWCKDRNNNSDPYGYIVVADVSWESCAYTARYCMKKRDGTEMWKLYEVMNVQPEFTNMSRRPGIGSNYFNSRGPGMFLTDGINISTNKGGKKIGIPRYYKRLASESYVEFMHDLSDMVVADVELKERLKLDLVSYDQDEFFRKNAQIVENKVKTLRRKDL